MADTGLRESLAIDQGEELVRGLRWDSDKAYTALAMVAYTMFADGRNWRDDQDPLKDNAVYETDYDISDISYYCGYHRSSVMLLTDHLPSLYLHVHTESVLQGLAICHLQCFKRDHRSIMGS